MTVQLPANATPARRSVIPAHERIGLCRAEAAEYIGVSPSLFDTLVVEGVMPQSKRIHSRKVWMRQHLEKAFAELPDARQDRGTSSPWRDCA